MRRWLEKSLSLFIGCLIIAGIVLVFFSVFGSVLMAGLTLLLSLPLVFPVSLGVGSVVIIVVLIYQKLRRRS